MVEHHRQQDGRVHARDRRLAKHVRRMRDQLDQMRAAACENSGGSEAKFGIACQGPRQRPAGRGLRKRELRRIAKAPWQELTRHGKTIQAEIAAIGDFERLGGVDDRQIAARADLLVAALSGAAESIELQIHEAEIVRRVRDMSTQPEHAMAGRLDQRYLNRRGIGARDRAFEGMVHHLARLEADKSCGEIVGPAAEGPIGAKRLG